MLSVRTTGRGTPVVIVHGTMDGIGAFSFVEVELAERFTVSVYDRRGRGGSGDTDEYSFEREVEDLSAVSGLDGRPPHVSGHSFGALVALRAALDGVEMRSLVLYEPPIHADAVSPTAIAEIARLIATGELDDAVRSMAQGLAGASVQELDLAMAVPPIRRTLREGITTAPRELEAIRGCSWSDAPLVGVPTLSVHGERRGSDAYPDTSEAGDLADDVHVVVLAGEGHVGHVRAPYDFVDAVGGILARH